MFLVNLILIVLEFNEIGFEISVFIRRLLIFIRVIWDFSIIFGVKGDINGFELVYELVKVNGKFSENLVRIMIVVGSNYIEYFLIDLLFFV